MVFGPKVFTGLFAHATVAYLLPDLPIEASTALFVVMYTAVAWKGFLIYTSKKDIVGATALHIASTATKCPLLMLLISVVQRI